MTGSPAGLLVPNHLARKPLDPLKRVFVPLENEGCFATHDGRMYERVNAKGLGTGQVKRIIPKLRGKAARAADKRARMRALKARPQLTDSPDADAAAAVAALPSLETDHA